MTITFKKGSPALNASLQAQLTLVSSIVYAPGSVMWFFLYLILLKPCDVWELLPLTGRKPGQRGYI